MTILLRGYRGMGLLLRLNSDRLLYLAMLMLALCAGAFAASP